ncbi:MAG TPA: SCP2 sterol-binding domain-containing protein [Actinomycetota bacterium]|nr:SCP2 sterol-binding domain-containing protein [Actinomycetota bacterium]
MRVTVVGSEPSGLTMLLSDLVEQNLGRGRERSRQLRASVVVLDVRDAAVTVHVRIDRDEVRVGDGDVPDAHVRVRTDSERLLALTSVPLRLGLPDPTRPDGRAVLRDLVLRRGRVHGLFRHPVRLARFTSLLSVAEAG